MSSIPPTPPIPPRAPEHERFVQRPTAPAAAGMAGHGSFSVPGGRKPASGWVIMGRIKAGMVVFTVLLAMVACVGLHPVLGNIVKDQGVKVEGLGAVYMAYPWLGVLLGLPALACCVPLFRGGSRTILWMSLATLLALLPFALLFMGFLAVVAPLYDIAVV